MLELIEPLVERAQALRVWFNSHQDHKLGHWYDYKRHVKDGMRAVYLADGDYYLFVYRSPGEGDPGDEDAQ